MRTPKSLLVALIAASCGPQYRIIALPPPPGSAPPPHGINLVVLDTKWSGEPYDLADYVTPIAVELSNAGPYEVRVSYADFALRDETGFRYKALNPYVPATTLGEAEAGEASSSLAAVFSTTGAATASPVLLASNGPIPQTASGAVVLAAATGGTQVGPPQGGRLGVSPRESPRGYWLHDGARHYYGPGPSYWRGPFFYGPGYGDWVFWWGGPYAPFGYRRPTQDILAYGLPEGVLSPGGRVNGFLYFQNATSRGAHQLDLTWELHDAHTNAMLGTVHVALLIERKR